MSNFIATIFAALIGVLGAELVKHIVRKAQRVEVDRDIALEDIVSSVASARDMADQYWTNSPATLGVDELRLSSKIVAEQQNISRTLSQLFEGNITPKRECDVEFLEVLDALSGGDFGDPNRQIDHVRLKAIYIATTKFTNFVARERRKLPRKFLS